ncbi:phosphotransferase [Pleurocapsales cyanobacterium LEGE 06147]|nr:phosphotransferase [Pleurocapsales cyanobacterium LEGE 06147]
MIKYATLFEAKAVVNEWCGIPETVEHINNSGSAVFRFKDSENFWQILRITDVTFRSYKEVQAELKFLSHLKNQSVNVAYGIPNAKGFLTTEFAAQSGLFICSVLSYVDGICVEDGSQYWDKQFFRKWGRSLASIHKASQSYNPPGTTPKPWIWSDEILFRQAEQLLPQDDFFSRQEYQEVLSMCHDLDRSSETFGVIHADYAPQNFHYNPVTNQIIAFDFGNCCYHWFVSDIAISLSSIRNNHNREEIKSEILAGYSEIKNLPDNHEKLINLFLRLRTIYVYLDRLYLFGSNPNIEQRNTLEQLKLRVHAKAHW